MFSDTKRAAATLDALDQVASLPAVPTRDWCQSGAEALGAALAPQARRTVFAVGVGTGRETLESLEAVGVCSADTKIRSSVEDCLARYTPVGPRPSNQSELSVLGAPELARTESWNRSPLMRVIASQGMIGLILGVGLISGVEPGRMLWILGAGEIAAESLVLGEASFVMVVLMAMMRRSHLALGGQAGRRIEWVSDREQETLELIVRGMSVREIAEQTGRSAHTVHDHVKSLHRKLRANSRGELVARALGHPPPEEARA